MNCVTTDLTEDTVAKEINDWLRMCSLATFALVGPPHCGHSEPIYSNIIMSSAKNNIYLAARVGFVTVGTRNKQAITFSVLVYCQANQSCLAPTPSELPLETVLTPLCPLGLVLYLEFVVPLTVTRVHSGKWSPSAPIVRQVRKMVIFRGVVAHFLSMDCAIDCLK